MRMQKPKLKPTLPTMSLGRTAMVQAGLTDSHRQIRAKYHRTMMRVGSAFTSLVLVASLLVWMPHKANASIVSQGPNSASATGDCTDNNGTGTVTWTSPGDAFSSNDTRASASVDGTVTHYIKCVNYGFSIPTGAVITGIVVGVERNSSSTGNGGSNDSAMRVIKGGTIGTTDRSTTTTWPTTDTYEDHGSSSDLWGDSWSVSDINGSTFGAAIAATKASAAGAAHTVSVDHVRITVYYSIFSKISQTGYIWENDDDSSSPIDEGTQQATGSTAITNVKRGERLNLRMQLKNTGTEATNKNLALFYDRNDGIWSKVTSPKPAVSTTGNCTNTDWICQTANSSRVADGMSLAISNSGQPWVSYRDFDAGSAGILVVTQYVGFGGNCSSSAWSCTTVDDPSNSMSASTSIGLSNSGTAWVSYHDATAGGLKIAQYVGSGGTGCTSSAWTCTVLDNPANDVGTQNHIVIDSNGNPWISYYDTTAGTLKIARYVGSGGTGCTSSAWTCTVVDGPTNSVGVQNSIALDAQGRAWVSYRDITAGTYKVALYVGSGGSGCASSAWTCTTIESSASGDASSRTDIAFDPSGNPWVAYTAPGLILKIAKYVGSGGSGCASSAWTCTTIDDPSDSVGGYVSMVFDPSGSPWISYHNATLNDLKIARYVGSGGSGCASSAWTCVTVNDNFGDTSSAAVDQNGNLWVTYSYASALQVAKLTRGGEILISKGAGTTGNALNESHADMTAVPDNSNRDDADCIGGGTWNNGLWSESEEISGLNLPNGSSTAQCSEVTFSIDTTQAIPGRTYRFIIASKDNWRLDRGIWRGPISVSAYATLTIESSTSMIAGKNASFKMTDCTDTTWGCDVVQDLATTGTASYSSMALDQSGTPWVSFRGSDGTSGTLAVAQYVGSGGTGCTSSAWTCTTIDDPSNSVGTETYIAFNSFGVPAIAYHDTTGDSLKYAVYVGSGGTGCTSSAWTCTTIDAGTSIGFSNTIMFDAGNIPWIIYNDGSTNAHVRSARYVGSGGSGCSATTAWTCGAIDDPANLTSHAPTSATLNSAGQPVVAYDDSNSSILKLAQYVGSGGTGCTNTAWTCTTIDDPSDLLQAGSIAIDTNGTMYVSHRDITTNSLRIAQYVGSGGTGCTNTAWTCTQIEDTASDLGTTNRLILDQSGNPMIAYSDSTANAIKFARYVASGGTGCSSSAWTCTTIDDPANTLSGFIGFTLDNTGTPWLSYTDTTNIALKVAKPHIYFGPLSQVSRLINTWNTSGGLSLGLLRLDSGYSPRTSSCGGVTDLKGYCGIAADDSDMDGITGTNERPVFSFAVKNNSPASVPTINWVGRSNIAPNTAGTAGDLVMEVYNYSTKAWQTVTTNTTSSNCSTADCTLSGTVSAAGTQNFYEQIGTDFYIYFRVWQYENASAETLLTDYFNVTFENTGTQLRGGTRFLNTVKSGFDL